MSVATARNIIQINSAYFQSKVLQSAVEIGVFEMLTAGPASAADIRDKLGLRGSLTVTYLSALAGLGLLTEEDGEYRNSPAAEEFLILESPTYLGATMQQHSRMHYHNWANLAETLRQDEPGAATSAEASQASFADHYTDLDRARKLMGHMDTFNGFVAAELARKIDWSTHSSFVDVGGARGNVAAGIVSAHPHLHGTVFDLPALQPLFDELMAARGAASQVTFAPGDFFADEFPEADVYIIGHVLHDWPVERRRELVARTFRAVRPGGILVIYDAMLDEPTPDVTALLQSLNCSMLRKGGSEYPVSECRSYVEEAGYTFVEAIAADTITQDRFVLARKSR